MSSLNCANPEINSSLNTAAKDKFVMILTLPRILQDLKKQDPLLDINYLQMNVYGTVVPSINVPPVEARFGGQSANFSSHSRPNYDPLDIKFLVDNDYKNYYVLWKWLNILNTADGSKYGGSPLSVRQQLINGPLTEYQTTFDIIALDEYNEPVIKFTYKNAFITNLGGIEYSYRDGQILELNAQFSFGQLILSTGKNISVLDK